MSSKFDVRTALEKGPTGITWICVFIVLFVILIIAVTVVAVAWQFTSPSVTNVVGKKEIKALVPADPWTKNDQHSRFIETKMSNVRDKKFQRNSSKIKDPLDPHGFPPGILSLVNGKTFVIQNMFNKGFLIPSIGAYPGAFSTTDLIYGGYVVNTNPDASNDQIAFTLITPHTSLVVPDSTWMIQNPKKIGLQWCDKLAIINTAQGKDYVASTDVRNDDNPAQLFAISIIITVNSGVVVAVIRNISSGKYMRICDTEGCLLCANVLLCGGNSGNITYVSCDYDLTEALADPKAQWIFTLSQ
jgi:hypothetical protein